mmetsp:Transcript_25929/g.72343  ORF Transcript_25929/g.72343 Transcript_25929/m.72343 type:complete len:212 (+) Transcript_25929:121-756(+)
MAEGATCPVGAPVRQEVPAHCPLLPWRRCLADGRCRCLRWRLKPSAREASHGADHRTARNASRRITRRAAQGACRKAAREAACHRGHLLEVQRRLHGSFGHDKAILDLVLEAAPVAIVARPLREVATRQGPALELWPRRRGHRACRGSHQLRRWRDWGRSSRPRRRVRLVRGMGEAAPVTEHAPPQREMPAHCTLLRGICVARRSGLPWQL